MKTVYCLQIRNSDSEPWGPTEYYRTRKDRNRTEQVNRCLGGIRTHSFEEQKTLEEIKELCD